jgi:hypothetical protein
MPIAFVGAVTPFNIVFGIDAAVLPAVFGFAIASALAIGIHEISAIEMIFINRGLALISIDGDSCHFR